MSENQYGYYHVINFGKFKNQTIFEIYKHSPSYLSWLKNKVPLKEYTGLVLDNILSGVCKHAIVISTTPFNKYKEHMAKCTKCNKEIWKWNLINCIKCHKELISLDYQEQTCYKCNQ